jgi:hypothetical protein
MTTCPACGEPAAQGQDYCLVCGARIAGDVPRGRGANRAWLVRAGIAGVVAVAGAAVAVAATSGGSRAESLTTALGGFTTARSAATLPGPQATPNGSSADWPAGVDGWTIALTSVPQIEGRKEAEARARVARRRGLAQVGVLDSSRYASLHPGYWIVFSGVYDSEAEATSALEAAKKVSRAAAVRHVVT